MAKLPDPVGERISYLARKDGLIIEKKWVPLGVVSVVYEARPDVVTDSAGICLRTGNALVLCGSRHSFNTDMATVGILKKALSDNSIDDNCIIYIEDTSHETKAFISQQKRNIDLMIIRGGVNCVDSLVSAATVPYIVAGEGNCHIFIDDSADYEMAVDIVTNSKVPRPKACNAAETILISSTWADKYFKTFAGFLHDNGLKLYGCENAVKLSDHIIPAEENHWLHEFFAPSLAVKIVEDVNEAIHHINLYRTPHTETIISSNMDNVKLFQTMVEANVICHNASTRFTDGIEFGLGGEIGISTQKFSVAGPIGMYGLMYGKYFLHGNGNIRQ